MGNLQKDRLGKVQTVDRTTVFYKCLPTKVEDEALKGYKVTSEAYDKRFKERAPVNHISKELFNKLLDNAPDKEDLGIVYDFVPEM